MIRMIATMRTEESERASELELKEYIVECDMRVAGSM